MIIVIRAVAPAVDVVRRQYGVDHLHESCGSMDFSSNSSLFHGIIRYYFVAIGDARVISNIWWFRRVGCIRGFTRKCTGTREYTFAICSQPAVAPVSARNGGGSRMWRYIRCELSRQIYSMGLMLWIDGWTFTKFSRCSLCILFRFNSCPVRLLSESATGPYSVLSGPANDLSSL